jgi:hypothetical protein
MKKEILINAIVNGLLTALASLVGFGLILIIYHLIANVTASELALMF